MKVLLENPDEVGRPALRMMTQYGDDAVKLAGSPAGLRILARESEPMMRAMIKSKGRAYSVLTRHGETGAAAVNKVSPGARRQLIDLVESGKIPEERMEPLLGVVAKYGDRAVKYIAKNAKGLAVGAGLAVLLTNPGDVIGPGGLISRIIDKLIELVVRMFTAVLEAINLTLVAGLGMGLIGVKMAVRGWWRMRAEARIGASGGGSAYRGSNKEIQ
jgi:hypothetical protein